MYIQQQLLHTNLACCKLSLKCLNECCLGITAKVQSLQNVGSKFKYKTFTTWDLMQNRLANDIKSGNVQCMKFSGCVFRKRVVFPGGFLPQNMMVKI